MAARQTFIDRRRNELDSWLQSCDICIDLATNSIVAVCGHLFCQSCLNEAFDGGLERRNVCPICSGELPDETAPRFPIVQSVASVGQTRARRTIVSEAAARAGNNIPMTEPTAIRITEARLNVVQNMLDAERERTHNRQVDLMRHFSNLRGQRIRELEQAFENIVEMNLALLRELEDRDEEIRRLQRRIVELENPTIHAGNIALGMNLVEHQRFGRRINPTPIATRLDAIVNLHTEEQPIPEFVEDGSSSTNSEARA